MPYNPETETFYQAPATVVDSTPDGDTVQEGFDDRLTPALAWVYADFNLLKADGMISVGIPATTTARGIGRVATSYDLVDGATINNGPAFLAAGSDAVTTTPTAHAVPQADEDGVLDTGYLPIVPIEKGGTGVDVSVPVLQRQHYRTGAAATGSTGMPYDNTVPQMTEGDQFLSLAFSPLAVDSKIEITVDVSATANQTCALVTALFASGDSNAIASTVNSVHAATAMVAPHVRHIMPSWGTAQKTFSVRCGCTPTSQVTVNGTSGNQMLAGTLESTITITEYAA